MHKNFYKKQLWLVTLLFLVTINLQAQTTGSYTNSRSGDGSADNPIGIDNVSDLLELSNSANSADWNLHFILTADLDMTGQSFTSIGYDVAHFTGGFNGDGNIISNLTVTDAGTNNHSGNGVFGYVDGSGAYVKNLGIENIVLSINEDNLGGIAGVLHNGATIENCHVKGGSISSSRTRAGGIVGDIKTTSSVKNCWCSASVSGGTTAWMYAGGIVGGSSNGESVIQNVAFYGSLSGSSRRSAIVGNASYGGAVPTNAYFTDGIPSHAGYGTAIPSENLDESGSYPGFNFTSVWFIGDTWAELQTFSSLQPPTLTINTPTDGSTYLSNQLISVSVSAEPNATSLSPITTVLLNDGTSEHAMVHSTGNEYTYSFNATAAQYELTATATDASGTLGTSNTITITLASPSISVITPTDGSLYNWGEIINVSANIVPNATSGAAITSVLLNDGTNNIDITSSKSGNNYNHSFTEDAESYQLTITATDANGAIATETLNITRAEPVYGGGGSGTPYILTKPIHFYQLCRYPNHWSADFSIDADIDFSDFNADSVMYSIGHSIKSFSGTINGNHHVLKNLVITPREGQTECLGFLGYAAGNNALNNLGFIHPIIDGGSSIAKVAVFAGRLQYGTNAINNCFTRGGYVKGNWSVASLVGNTQGAEIKNCFSSTAVLYNTRGGALLGEVAKTTKVDNCAFYGTIENINSPSAETKVVESTQYTEEGYRLAHLYYNSTHAPTLNDETATPLTSAEMRDSTSFKGFDFISIPTWSMAGTVKNAGSTRFTGFPVLNSFGTKASELSFNSTYKPGWELGILSVNGISTRTLGDSLNVEFTPVNENYAVTNLWINDIQYKYWDEYAESRLFDGLTLNTKLEVMFEPINEVVTGANNTKNTNQILINNKVLHINSINNNNTVSIYNISGQKILKKDFAGSTYQFPVSFKSGIYIISLNNSFIRKVLIK